MKHFYPLLVLFCLVFCKATAQVEVIDSIYPHITSADQLYEGQKIAFFCYGATDSTDTHFRTRYAYVMEDESSNFYIYREVETGNASSGNFIWTIAAIEVDSSSDTPTAYIKLQTPQGNYLSNFSSYAPTVVSTVDEAATFTVTQADGDSLFYITDEAGIYFNGNNTSSTGYSGFVGWSASGVNSNYMIMPITTTTISSSTATLYFYDTDENEIAEAQELTTTVGYVITAPEIENYSFVRAEDYNSAEAVELPDTVTELNEIELLLYYEQWPLVSVICYDQEGNIIYTEDTYTEPGTQFEEPTLAELGFGWELVSSDYAGNAINNDTLITMIYAASATGGLPFTPTTIDDSGNFADGTTYFFMIVRGGYVYYNASDSLNVTNSIANTDSIDYYLWAATGDLTNGFQFYNKAFGTSCQMFLTGTSDGTYAQLCDEDERAANADGLNTFMIAFNMDGTTYGYALYPVDNTTACLNRYGGSTGADLRIWNSSYSPTDVGSRFVFTEVSEELAEAYKYFNYQVYLDAQDCVGGYTASQLSSLQAAVTAKDLTACSDALAALVTEDTIAFNPESTYNIISAYTGFSLYQPGVTYAIYANEVDSVVWNAIDGASTDNESYLWAFQAVTDTTYLINNVADKNAIASFRFGDYAALFNDSIVSDSTTTTLYQEGEKAPFQIIKSTIAPASYRLVHNYGSSIITLSAFYGAGDGEATSGAITTYNTTGSSYGNIWRLKPVGTVPTAIDAIETNTDAASEAIYDLSGRAVKKAAKGLYIMKGKKVYVK